jgi:enolase-phosphatase E1
LSGYYDTTSGQKQDAESYTRIAKDMGFAPEDVIFFSDRIEGTSFEI